MSQQRSNEELPGKSLERDVCTLLEAQGWVVQTEHLVLSKKIDLYAEKTIYLGERRRLSIECKDFSRRLTKKDVAIILAEYKELIDQNTVDELLLVTRNGLSPAAFTFCKNTHGIIHKSYSDLLNGMMDFRSYARDLMLAFENSDVYKQYIPQMAMIDGKDTVIAEEHVKNWASQKGIRPYAILAGYGMGKTTLAMTLCAFFARRYLENPYLRAPNYY